MNATNTTTDTTAENAGLLLGLMSRLNEFKTNMYGEINDGDGGEWTPDELIEAIAKVKEMVEELDLLEAFAEKAKEMAE